jgi:hypothetical protein
LEKNIEEFPAARKEIESMDKRTHVGIARLEKDLPPSAAIEKRKHTRFLLNLPVEYSFFNSSIVYSSHSINASESGLLLCLQQPLKVGQLINLKVHFHSGSNLLNIEAIAEVVWVDEVLRNREEYRHGVRFVTITEKGLHQFKSFLDALSPMT